MGTRGYIARGMFLEKHITVNNLLREGQIWVVESKPSSLRTPDLERAVQLLRDLPALGQHPGVTPEQGRDLVREVFEEVWLREGVPSAVKLRPNYAPIFAQSLWKDQGVVVGQCSP